MTSNIIVNIDNPEIFRYASADEVPGIDEISINSFPNTDFKYLKIVDSKILEMTDSEKQNVDSANSFIDLRKERDMRLKNTDWIIIKQYEDNMLSISKYQPWLDYRQSLRDLPKNTINPLNPSWPTKPK